MIKYLLFFLLVASTAFGQAKLAKNGIPYRARAIVVKTDLPADKLFDVTAKTIFKNGFQIKQSTEAIGLIQTEHKKVKGGWWLKVIATVDGNTVKFEGMAAGQRYAGVTLVNKKRNKHKFAFEAMNEVARAIPHTSIEYLQ